MKSRLACTFATMLFAGAVAAQAPSSPPTDKPVTFAPEPVASTLNTNGPDAQLASDLAQALNQDGSFKDTKITVQPDGGVIYLTGAAPTEEMARHASEVVAARAGDAKVVNLIQPDQTSYRTWSRLAG